MKNFPFTERFISSLYEAHGWNPQLFLVQNENVYGVALRHFVNGYKMSRKTPSPRLTILSFPKQSQFLRCFQPIVSVAMSTIDAHFAHVS